MIRPVYTILCHWSYDYEAQMLCASFGTLGEARLALKNSVSYWNNENPEGFGEYTTRVYREYYCLIYRTGDYTRNHIEWTIFCDNVEFKD